MIHTNHLLLSTPLNNDQDKPLFSTKGGSCTCGKWYIWAESSLEIEAAHDHHIAFQKKQEEQQQAYQYAKEVNLHQFDWTGSGAYCRGCTWQMSGIDRSRQREAFSHHLETVRRETLRRNA